MPFDWEGTKNFLEPPKRFIPRITQPVTLSSAGLVAWLRKQMEGNRNNGTFWAFNRAIEAGHSPESIAEAALQIGLAPIEVKKTLDSAMKRGGKH